MESSGCKSRTAKASMRAGSECCHSPGDWRVRSVHSKEVGREDSAPKFRLVAMPTLLTRRKAVSGRPLLRGRAGIAGVPSSGHASKRSGHGTHWREGGNRCTYLAKGNIDEAQTSTRYVHTNRQNNRTGQEGS